MHQLHKSRLPEDELVDTARLNPAQFAGHACIRCGMSFGGTSPVRLARPAGFAVRGEYAAAQLLRCDPDDPGGCEGMGRVQVWAGTTH